MSSIHARSVPRSRRFAGRASRPVDRPCRFGPHCDRAALSRRGSTGPHTAPAGSRAPAADRLVVAVPLLAALLAVFWKYHDKFKTSKPSRYSYKGK